VASSAELDPLRLRPHGLGFDELKELREYLESLLGSAQRSLQHFQEDEYKGFLHQDDGRPRSPDDPFSKASTATCVAFLRAAGTLEDLVPTATHIALRERMIDGDEEGEWKSADLRKDNPFTVSFLLEAIWVLGKLDGIDPNRSAVVQDKLNGLEKELGASGGLAIEEYDPTAFLTYKALRVLKLWRRPKIGALREIRAWTWDHLARESMLIASGSPDADVFELAYSVLTASAALELHEMTPRERWMMRYALDQFFDHQLDDGTWPRSRPLFLYPNLGYAYCFDYELLVSMLADRQVAGMIFGRITELRKAAKALDDRRFPLRPAAAGEDGPVYGWSSGHHGRKRQAESWATASVFHFCLELDQLVSEAIRRDVFDYVGVPYDPPRPTPGAPELPKDFLDSTVKRGEARRSLKQVLADHFLGPLVQARDRVREGRKFPDDVSVSAILYGPPGTSKTELAKAIAKALGWPLLSLDPSHLTRHGLDDVHSEADTLFGRLQFCDQIVVLLDEFDELVREREEAGELHSRFLTTAMLPKLTALSERRRLVYLVATNHLEQFDAAIRRPGRFDVILPLMPPTLDAKLQEWPVLTDALGLLRGEEDTIDLPAAESILTDLTYLEAKELAKRLATADTAKAVSDTISRAGDGSTVRQPLTESEPEAGWDWGVRMTQLESRIRIKGYEM
jgi:hypothetical protein